MILDLHEIQDGVLTSSDNVLMKVRCPELFPDNIKSFFSDKVKIQKTKMEIGIEKTIIRAGDKKSIFYNEYINYIKNLGVSQVFLSNKSVAEDADCYPLIAKYRYGWVVVAPLEA